MGGILQNNRNYISSTAFKKEKNFFLKNIFILIGHKCEFKKVGDYKTIEIYGKSIVIYNFSKKISAFTNVCAHRGSSIFKERFGNSLFKCPYHAWNYDENGYPKFIPLEKKITNKKNIKKDFSLEEWKLEFCGEFIFLKSKKNKNSLKKFLGDKYNSISTISKKIHEKVDIQIYKWHSNWKICIENSIDEYHAIFLHESTFKNTLTLEPKYNCQGNIMEMSTPLSESYNKKIFNLKKYFNKAHNNYEHIYIFPVSSIATTGDNSFYIQSYLPKDNSHTEITTTIYMPNISHKMTKNVKNFYQQSCIKFNNLVFLEDKEICEDIFKNIQNNNIKKDFIGKLEYRIKEFRRLLKNTAYK